MYGKARVHGQHAGMQDSVTCAAEKHADKSTESFGMHLLKGHAIQDHLCACSNILHGDHVHAHAKPVQQLRPQLTLLHSAPLCSDLRTAPMSLSCPWQCTFTSMHCTLPAQRHAVNARGQAQHSADERRVCSTSEHSTGRRCQDQVQRAWRPWGKHLQAAILQRGTCRSLACGLPEPIMMNLAGCTMPTPSRSTVLTPLAELSSTTSTSPSSSRFTSSTYRMPLLAFACVKFPASMACPHETL